MEIFKVGGSVRDQLLNIPSKDIDFVVVGSSPEEMESLGYKQVGADFPIFLDRGGREFALARIERKTAAGYHGFECTFDNSVTLEQDLSRRDLTINAMAQRVTSFTHHKIRTFKYDDAIIDPFNGQQDLHDGILRHVSDAFSEDPVRALRIARFSARYGFLIHVSTSDLLREMDRRGEFDALVVERVWNEFQKAMMEPYPDNFFKVLMHHDLMEKILKVKSDDLRLGRLMHANTLHMSLTVKLLVTGFTRESIRLMSGPADTIKFLTVYENFCQQCGEFFKFKLSNKLICELYKRFGVLHQDSWMGATLIELMKFKAVTENSVGLYEAIDPSTLNLIRQIKLPEDIDIPAHQRGEYLWNQRQQLLETFQQSS